MAHGVAELALQNLIISYLEVFKYRLVHMLELHVQECGCMIVPQEMDIRYYCCRFMVAPLESSA